LLHPALIVRRSPLSGKGLFATEKIRKGTIIWIWKDENEKVYSRNQFEGFSKRYQSTLLKYGTEYNGSDLINYSLDNSKYWNHSCNPNTAPTCSAMVMDIALRDIRTGEEITFDYSLVQSPSWPLSFKCNCGAKNCRGTIPTSPLNSDMLDNLFFLAKEAKKNFRKVYQPLLTKLE
jgi:SET domain-containing protein